MAREVVAVLELELGLAGSLGRHRQDVATRLRLSRDGGAELLVDEDAGAIARGATTDRLLEAFEDESLRVADAGTHLIGDRRGRVEEVLLERSTVIEREQVQRFVVPEVHGHSPVGIEVSVGR